MRHQASGLEDARRAGGAGPRPLVLGIASGKGGVGKSTLAVNLAVAASVGGASVLLVDGDAGLANADLLMGLVPRADVQDWVEGRVALDDAVCRGPAGLSLMLAGESAPAFGALRDAVAGGPGTGLGPFLAGFDLTVLDLGAGIGEGVVELASVCARLWLVTTPEPTSMADVYAMAKRVWERAPASPLELVVNRAADGSEGERTHGALTRLTQRFLGRPLPLRGVVPDERALVRSVAEQTPLVLRPRPTAAARRIALMAESLLEQGSAAVAERGAGVRLSG